MIPHSTGHLPASEIWYHTILSLTHSSPDTLLFPVAPCWFYEVQLQCITNRIHWRELQVSLNFITTTLDLIYFIVEWGKVFIKFYSNHSYPTPALTFSIYRFARLSRNLKSFYCFPLLGWENLVSDMILGV